METSNRLEAGGEEVENKKAEEPKTNQMGKRVNSLSTGSEMYILWLSPASFPYFAWNLSIWGGGSTLK